MKIFWLTALALCFCYIREMLPKVINAIKDSYGECNFKCKNSVECDKRCGQFCRTFGECEMCETDDCGKCVFKQHIQ